jgi:hypothetical protein
MAGDLSETRIEQEAGAIFRRRAAEEGWPGFHTGTLTIELRIRVGRRDTRGAIGIAHNARLPDLAQVRWLHILENSEPHWRCCGRWRSVA